MAAQFHVEGRQPGPLVSTLDAWPELKALDAKLDRVLDLMGEKGVAKYGTAGVVIIIMLFILILLSRRLRLACRSRSRTAFRLAATSRPAIGKCCHGASYRLLLRMRRRLLRRWW